MVTRLGVRPGHSIPELVVAVALLATCLGGVSAAGQLGAARTRHAAVVHEALALATALADSLTALPAPSGGRSVQGRLIAEWAPSAAGGMRVTVRLDGARDTVAVLESRPFRAPPRRLGP